MNLSLESNEFCRGDLRIRRALAHHSYLPEYLDYFDKDGFELTPFERTMYTMDGIPVYHQLYHYCNQLNWYTQAPGICKGLILDHALLLHRYGVAGELRARLEDVAKLYPVFHKLLDLQPKWGLDFSLDFVDERGALEVWHFEFDARHRQLVVETKAQVEEFVAATDWYDVVRRLRLHIDEWIHLQGSAQGDWKSQFLGWPRAESKQKPW